jgi:hypothetical protein
MDLRSKIDIVSDEFGSTFSYINEQSLANMLTIEDLPVAEAILKRHLGSGLTFKFQKTNQLPENSSGRDIWVITINLLP